MYSDGNMIILDENIRNAAGMDIEALSREYASSWRMEA